MNSKVEGMSRAGGGAGARRLSWGLGRPGSVFFVKPCRPDGCTRSTGRFRLELLQQGKVYKVLQAPLKPVERRSPPKSHTVFVFRGPD